MSIDFSATYRDGVLYPDAPLNLPNNTPVHVTVATKPASGPPASQPPSEPTRLTPPPAPRITVEEFDALVEKYSVSVGSLPPDFSRADIYSDHD